MAVLTSETCWAWNNEIKKQVTSSWSLFIQLWSFLKHKRFVSGTSLHKVSNCYVFQYHYGYSSSIPLAHPGATRFVTSCPLNMVFRFQKPVLASLNRWLQAFLSTVSDINWSRWSTLTVVVLSESRHTFIRTT